ncbi:hypothetical protein H4P12_08485 [Paracoccus sp. 11-3]|uniref:Uncharacterized protein n=1 Tax=Paracoccus amoyensis TaxID=2760093 RepID=A0A926G6J9_9RHOB|nr:hypothetical protein [Paracoccus amoyensis]MBC9246748.1 hypothetical protein [Paracoccus amoyensis]
MDVSNLELAERVANLEKRMAYHELTPPDQPDRHHGSVAERVSAAIGQAFEVYDRIAGRKR